MKKQLLFIFNPATGGGRIKSRLMEILCKFSDAGYALTVCPTAAPGDARAYTLAQAAGMDLVVCCGGDGTLNETVDGLMQLDNPPPLGYIPAGTTNDFASSLHLPKQQLLRATDRILHPNRHYRCDVGFLGQRAFTYVAAFGAFTAVSYSTSQASKNLLGYLAYLLGGMQQLPKLHTQHLRIECDGAVFEGDYLLGMITNSASVAGFTYPGKQQVRLDDGRLELLLVHMPQNIAQLGEISAAFLSGKADSPLLTVHHLEKATITSEEEIAWTLDGEFGGSFTQVDFSVRKRALKICI